MISSSSSSGDNAVPYDAPSAPLLLAMSSFLFLINIADYVCTRVIHAGLIGPLLVGMIFGPHASNILPSSAQFTFIALGYIGLILIVFEAGLSGQISLFFRNIVLSLVVAITGILLPIGVSLLLLSFGYKYSWLQAFTAGAALCSTSLGTTIALLDPRLRNTKVGVVLMSAALLDDIAGLVIASIISQLTSNGILSGITWQAIVRPIMVSFSFAFGTPVLAFVLTKLTRCLSGKWLGYASSGPAQLWIMVTTLSGFVAAARYAGTSDLFGAYLAGVFLTWLFDVPRGDVPRGDNELPKITLAAFTTYITPLLAKFLSPIFFASIGMAIPIRTLGSVEGSHRVVWRGWVYAFLMIATKAVVGVWLFIWPNSNCPQGESSVEAGLPMIPHLAEAAPSPEAPTLRSLPHRESLTLSHRHQALLLGLAMVARGEIALIVAQLGRPLIMGVANAGLGAEAFAVVIWAILVTTVLGAVGVGQILRAARNTCSNAPPHSEPLLPGRPPRNRLGFADGPHRRIDSVGDRLRSATAPRSDDVQEHYEERFVSCASERHQDQVITATPQAEKTRGGHPESCVEVKGGVDS